MNGSAAQDAHDTHATVTTHLHAPQHHDTCTRTFCCQESHLDRIRGHRWQCQYPFKVWSKDGKYSQSHWDKAAMATVEDWPKLQCDLSPSAYERAPLYKSAHEGGGGGRGGHLMTRNLTNTDTIAATSMGNRQYPRRHSACINTPAIYQQRPSNAGPSPDQMATTALSVNQITQVNVESPGRTRCCRPAWDHNAG